ncbi:HAAS signaling domain-containing protein [Streptomyces sp. PTD5-9]|uniref:HAAS signaling domain-containing protein n=1 Tax=Streptomyces sp. PTD5-9 TaxID=3120150 RepID=UPI00300A6A5D
MKTAQHPLVKNYLAAVARETAGLDEESRNELIADLDEHITVALAKEADPADESIRAVLARLGDPRSIAASALGESPAAAPVRRWYTVVPLVLLALAGLATVTAPLAGVALAIVAVVALWATPQWQTRDKVIGTAAALLVPVLLALLGLLLGIGAATGGVAVRGGTILAAVITPLAITSVACVYLFRAGRRPACPRPQGAGRP